MRVPRLVLPALLAGVFVGCHEELPTAPGKAPPPAAVSGTSPQVCGPLAICRLSVADPLVIVDGAPYDNGSTADDGWIRCVAGSQAERIDRIRGTAAPRHDVVLITAGRDAAVRCRSLSPGRRGWSRATAAWPCARLGDTGTLGPIPVEGRSSAGFRWLLEAAERATVACPPTAPTIPPSAMTDDVGGRHDGSGAGRGHSRLRDRQPLFVVDGVPIDPDSPISRVRDVDPATITSLVVLRDRAAATAFGRDGRNGVVLIRTTRALLAPCCPRWYASPDVSAEQPR